MSEGYHVYGNGGSGPVNYDTIIGTISGFATTTWTWPGLTPGDWQFAVRAFNSDGEEQNLDCAVSIDLDANGNDITNIPLPPTGLRAFPTPAGGIRVEWWYPPTTGPTQPTGFYLYLGTSGTPDYSASVATVLHATGIANTFVANVSGLTSGTTYAVGVRAYNASGIEQNVFAAPVTADAIGPAAVSSLSVTAIV